MIESCLIVFAHYWVFTFIISLMVIADQVYFNGREHLTNIEYFLLLVLPPVVITYYAARAISMSLDYKSE